MDRRQFLSSSVLRGLGLGSLGLSGLAVATPARAFEVQSCDSVSGTQVCQEIVRHHELLADMDDMLKKKGLDAKQRQTVMAAAICPFCGQPLIG